MKNRLHARLAASGLQIRSCWFDFFVSRETFLYEICCYGNFLMGISELPRVLLAILAKKQA